MGELIDSSTPSSSADNVIERFEGQAVDELPGPFSLQSSANDGQHGDELWRAGDIVEGHEYGQRPFAGVE